MNPFAPLRWFVVLGLLTLPLTGSGQQEVPVADIVVLVDTSQSMGTRDDYSHAQGIAEAVKRLAKDVGAGEKPTRLQLATALITRKDRSWLDALAARDRDRVRL